MKRRFLYLLLFTVPAVLLALLVAGVAVAGSAGVLWLLVFGDDPWPRQSGLIIAAVAVLAAAPVLGVALTVAYRVGQAQESAPHMPRGHLALAFGSTLLLCVVIALQLAGPRRGPASDSERCSDFCVQAGLATSSMPRRDSGLRTCTCLDDQGKAVQTIELTN